jgi:sulfide:quinone oxidoreductase
MRVLVLGAGFGGLELTTDLAKRFGEAVEITLIDKTESFVFGFSKLDVMFGRSLPEQVEHAYADVVKPGVEFVQAEITAIDAQAKTVQTSAGEFSGDFLVIALGADYDISLTPGLAEHGEEFYTEAGAFALREKLENFSGGRVVVGVSTAPFKCPPAPSETVLLIDELLKKKGVRDTSTIELAMPFGRPIPPSPEASDELIRSFAERDITWHPDSPVTSLEAGVAHIGDQGEALPFDLYLGVPAHVAPKVLIESGLAPEGGYVAVDPTTLQTDFDGVYAVGDVAAVGTPRAGVFAEGQAQVAADQIAARIANETTDEIYRGRGTCYIEFGGGSVGKVEIEFFGDVKQGKLVGPEIGMGADKTQFGSERIKRWFGRDWQPDR